MLEASGAASVIRSVSEIVKRALQVIVAFALGFFTCGTVDRILRAKAFSDVLSQRGECRRHLMSLPSDSTLLERAEQVHLFTRCSVPGQHGRARLNPRLLRSRIRGKYPHGGRGGPLVRGRGTRRKTY